jgi:hypothetical protein
MASTAVAFYGYKFRTMGALDAKWTKLPKKAAGLALILSFPSDTHSFRLQYKDYLCIPYKEVRGTRLAQGLQTPYEIWARAPARAHGTPRKLMFPGFLWYEDAKRLCKNLRSMQSLLSAPLGNLKPIRIDGQWVDPVFGLKGWSSASLKMLETCLNVDPMTFYAVLGSVYEPVRQKRLKELIRISEQLDIWLETAPDYWKDWYLDNGTWDRMNSNPLFTESDKQDWADLIEFRDRLDVLEKEYQAVISSNPYSQDVTDRSRPHAVKIIKHWNRIAMKPNRKIMRQLIRGLRAP